MYLHVPFTRLELHLARAVPQTDHQDAAGGEQLGENSERPFPFRCWQMHPNRADQDEIEALVEFSKPGQLGQFVVEPGDIGVAVLFRPLPESGLGLHCDHIPAFFRQPVGIATGTGADVAGQAGLFG